MRVTIREVARAAGVSVATVSRVLNGKEVVREETLRQVLEAAKALSYVPNVAARALSIRRSQTVGVGTAFQNPFSAFLGVHRAF